MPSRGNLVANPRGRGYATVLSMAALLLLGACDATSALFGKTGTDTSSAGGGTEAPDTATEGVDAAYPAALVWSWETGSIGEWRMGGSSIPEVYWPENGGLGVRAPLEPEAPDLHVRSPALTIQGSDYDRVMVDLECIKPAGMNDLAIFYVTPNHPESPDFRNRPVNNAPMSAGERVVFSYDMSGLLVGGTDWVDSEIQQIRFDFPQGAGSDYVLHSIRLCSSKDPTCK